jgi:two-component system, sensor histidine kinase and response regulator
MALMVSVASRDQRYIFLATALATRRDKRIALLIAAAAFILFAAFVPFVRVPLPQSPAFIPSYEAALIFIDLTTAVLLFDQSARLRSIGVLVLSCGYLFDALIIIPHALSFPGAFALHGLLGAKAQTTAWLYVMWHGGFPLFVIGYALLRRREERGPPWTFTRMDRLIGASVAGVVLLVTALALLATWGHDWLPIVMQGSDYSLLVKKGVSPAVWGLTLVAMLSLWRDKQRVVDLWLMLVMWVWLFDIALAAIIGSHRFDLGFYAGRVFGLVAASFLLVSLLAQMARLHARAVSAAAEAQAQLAQVSRSREQSGPGAARGERTESFIARQNIAHYRSMLESGTLDENQRRSIEQLLAEEEAKLRSK